MTQRLAEKFVPGDRVTIKPDAQRCPACFRSKGFVVRRVDEYEDRVILHLEVIGDAPQSVAVFASQVVRERRS